MRRIWEIKAITGGLFLRIFLSTHRLKRGEICYVVKAWPTFLGGATHRSEHATLYDAIATARQVFVNG